jgi:Fe-S-cluster-containing hydrogenase component 2
VGCGCCTEVCITGALEMNDTATIYEEVCIDCKRCITMCPVDAIA